MSSTVQSNVSSEVGAQCAGLSRRNVMNLMSAVVAAPAITLPFPAVALTVDRNDWENALAVYFKSKGTFDRLWAEHGAAEEADDADCPRVDHYFDEWKLGIGMKRDRVVETLSWYNQRAGKQLNVQAMADEFMAYQVRHAESRQRHRLDELNNRAADYGEEQYFPARDALMRTPAPDEGALLFKLEIAATSCDDGHIASVYDDAKRLLAKTS